ncbi:MAG: hypothetical protein V7K96_27790 [Nostoc sp.]
MSVNLGATQLSLVKAIALWVVTKAIPVAGCANAVASCMRMRKR